jgi:hypothetical protein
MSSKHPLTSPVRPSVELMPSQRGGPSPRTRTISPNKPIRNEKDKNDGDDSGRKFESTLRGNIYDGGSSMSRSMKNAPDLENGDWEDVSPESDLHQTDFLKESQDLDKILTLAGKKARTSVGRVDNSNLAQSRFQHAKMYHQINNLPKSKAEIYNQLVELREKYGIICEKYKKESAARKKASVMCKLEQKKNKEVSDLDAKIKAELRELRQSRREVTIQLKATIADFNNYKRERELEILKMGQDAEFEKQKLKESLLTEQQKAAQHFTRTSESREREHQQAMLAKAEELAKQRAELEKHKIELETNFLNKIKRQQTGFGSEKMKLQDRLKEARNHLQNAREKAMSEKEREMVAKHKEEIKILKEQNKEKIKAKDKEIRDLKKAHILYQREKEEYIRKLEHDLRQSALREERRIIKQMDDEYDYLAKIGIPAMDVEGFKMM